MQIEVKIKRFHPEKQEKPHFVTYTLDVDPNERVMDVIEHIRDTQDGSLAYRRSCGHAVCGSCAMRINGRNALACKTLIKDLGRRRVTLEPLLGLAVIKDLVVDMDPFFEHYETILPFLMNDEPPPEGGKERLQSPEQRGRFDDTTKCILCAACTASCPSFWANRRYVGPAALVNAHRFLFDSRDTGISQRLSILNQPDAIWRCRTIFNCTEACPRDIQITRAIAEIRQLLNKPPHAAAR